MNQEETRTYESIIILRPSLNDMEIQQFTDVYVARLEQSGGTMVTADNWGKRKLAYEVKGERKGTYIRFGFCGKGTIVRSLENANRIDDMILKSMTVRVRNTPDNTEPRNEVEG